jgi:hypothetical protein
LRPQCLLVRAPAVLARHCARRECSAALVSAKMDANGLQMHLVFF